MELKQEQMIAEMENYLNFIDKELERIDRDRRNVDQDVKKDLQELIDKELSSISNDTIRKKILEFKDFKTTKENLLREKKLESLNRTERGLEELKMQVKSFVDSLSLKARVS